MTLKLRITNEGPAPYGAIITRPDGMRQVDLAAGESAEVYCWEGAPVTITESKKAIPPKAPAQDRP